MKFEELEFKPHDLATAEILNCGKLAQATWKTENGYTVSILFGELFYSNGVDTYEAWVIGKKLPTNAMYENPVGYLTPTEVEEYIKGVESL